VAVAGSKREAHAQSAGASNATVNVAAMRLGPPSSASTEPGASLYWRGRDSEVHVVVRACAFCGTKNHVPAGHLADTGRCGACKRALPPVDEPLEVDAAGFDEVVRGATVPVLVDFWAAWCGPCLTAAPEVKRTAADMAGKAVVLKVDTDRYPEVAARFGVRGIPNFVVLKDGRLVSQQAGAVDHRQMEEWLERAQEATS
jgi:thioredoxin 2